MSSNDADLRMLAKYPDLIPIHEALAQHSRGESVTARCLKCNGILTVTGIKAVDTVWVTCTRGCTAYHETYAPGTLSDK
jgi:hypothetical protein